jgi:hypothetical protein
MAENNDNDRTERIRNSRTEDSTKRIYAGKLEIVVDWFRGNFPQYVVDNSLQYDQIPDKLWEDLFSYLSRPKEGRRRRKRGDYLSFEHVVFLQLFRCRCFRPWKLQLAFGIF